MPLSGWRSGLFVFLDRLARSEVLPRPLTRAERNRILYAAESAVGVPPVIAAYEESWRDEARGHELYLDGGLNQRLEHHDFVGSLNTVELTEPGMRPIGPWPEGADLLGCPTFSFTGITGPGSHVVAAGEGDDPPVVVIDHIDLMNRNNHGGTFSLGALRLSRYFEGLILPNGLGRWDPTADRLGPSTELVPPTDQLAHDDDRVVGRFDILINSMVGQPLPARGTVPVGLQRVAGNPFYQPFLRSLDPLVLRTRMAALVGMAMMVANLQVWAEKGLGDGMIVDRIGLFGLGPGQRLLVEEASQALLGLAVEGDLDDLCLTYRERVAVPLNQHHRFWT